MPKTRPDVTAALRATRLWRAAGDIAIVELAAGARVEDYPRGRVLAMQGDLADRIGVVVSGTVKVYQLGADGRALTFEKVGAGQPFGAVAALAGTRYPATVETATAATIAWITRDALFELVGSDPELTRTLVTDLAERVVNLTAVASTLSLDVPSRLAAYLFQRALECGRTTPSGLVVELGMSKGELASALGTVPETLSRALARLRDDGVLVVRTHDVIVKDVGALARLGGGSAR
jgi:CRP/FNR family transcriptional regulator, dissimilatory nitrate respiration regulator